MPAGLIVWTHLKIYTRTRMSRKSKKTKTASSVSAVFVIIVAVVWLYTYIDHPRTTAEKMQLSVTAENSTAQAAPEPVSAGHSSDRAVSGNMEWAEVTDSRPQQIIRHTGYTLSYHPEWHVPNWVAWVLTADEVTGEEERSNHFRPDPLVQGDPIVTKDYSNSGYDRGHMAPAADMKWSEQAMRESFYMTNMCPQNHSCNAGDWKDLEEMERDLAQRYDSIFIVCGPIVKDPLHTIGTERKIVVPEAFFKAFLRYTGKRWTAIAFRLPNTSGNRPLMTYMLPVDSVEKETAIDLFYLLPDSIETAIESDYTVSDWTIK